ncbi:PEP-CTERM sorting domain-containing protein [Plectonema cf. radiosum LEGE 06105]|uniref:PEP-CTERM sorting domain-containing protein n=1 Tax=Plectonema cf. radiosum LEGE 06105 TaxID=945769 RepID=A0A8J7F5X4_9CYAN|nr:PEP-CTERM sorting domain-containing protein [Plectonema radiosum]MBE9214490.1 PEP-CTERM sorting domain-containing protein [Plectonema cf. radiosum LEGE 06105]
MSISIILKKLSILVIGTAFIAIGTANNAQATSIILDGFGGDAGFGDLALPRNDDGSTNQLNLPFGINFFGNDFDRFFINNNGNLTFSGPLSGFTPQAFPISNLPMIAPFWADVDTRCAFCGEVYVASPNSDTVVVTWNNVGYYNQNSDKTNTFQTVLRNRQDTGNGNFDIEYRYDQLEWTTGDASGGSNGFGGTPAQAGFDAGDLTNFFTLPGSRTNEVLNLQNTSNLPEPVPGVWSFAVRNGQLPGSSPENPLLPVITEEGFNFDFNIINPTVPIFIDPVIAVGYSYIVDNGPNIASVLLPTGIGDDLYDLFLFDAALNDYIDSGFDITGGNTYDFASSGVDRFRILGIETSAGLDPNNPTAFVTGLTFVNSGNVQMRQIPIVQNSEEIPEPMTILGTLTAGAFGTQFMRKRKQMQAAKSEA